MNPAVSTRQSHSLSWQVLIFRGFLGMKIHTFNGTLGPNNKRSSTKLSTVSTTVSAALSLCPDTCMSTPGAHLSFPTFRQPHLSCHHRHRNRHVPALEIVSGLTGQGEMINLLIMLSTLDEDESANRLELFSGTEGKKSKKKALHLMRIEYSALFSITLHYSNCPWMSPVVPQSLNTIHHY